MTIKKQIYSLLEFVTRTHDDNVAKASFTSLNLKPEIMQAGRQRCAWQLTSKDAWSRMEEKLNSAAANAVCIIDYQNLSSAEYL